MKKFDEMILVKLHYFINWSIEKINKGSSYWLVSAGLLAILLQLFGFFKLVFSDTQSTSVEIVMAISKIVLCVALGAIVYVSYLIKDKKALVEIKKEDLNFLSLVASFVRVVIVLLIFFEIIGNVCYVNNILDGMILKKIVPTHEIISDVSLLLFLYFFDILHGISKKFLRYYSYNEEA